MAREQSEPRTEQQPAAVPRRRVWLRRAGWAAVAFVVATAAAYLSRNTWAPTLVARLAPRFGYEASVQGISGDWVREITLVGLRVRGVEEDATLRSLSGRSLALEVAPLELLRGGNWLRRAEAVGLEAVVYLGPDGEDSSVGDEEGADLADIVDALPELSLRDISLRLETPEGAPFELHDLAARLHRPDTDAVLELGATVLDARVQLGATLASRTIEADFDVAGLDWEVAEDVFGLANPAEPRGVFDLRGTGALNIDDPLDFSVEGQLEVDDLKLAGRSFGPSRAQLEMDGLELRAPWIELESETNQLRLEDALWDLGFDDVDAALEAAHGRFEVALTDVGGLIDPERGATSELAPPEHRLQLSGRLVDGALELDTGHLELETGTLEVASGRLALVGPNEGAVALELDARISDLAPFSELVGRGFCAGELEGAVHVSGTLEQPLGKAQLTGRDVFLFGVEVGELELDLDSDTEALRISAVRTDCPSTQLELAGAFDYTTGEVEDLILSACLSDAGPIALPEFVEELGRTQIEAQLSGPLEALSGSLRVTGEKAVLGGMSVDSLELQAYADKGRWHVPRLFVDSEAAQLDAGLRLLPDSVVRPGAPGLTIKLESLSLVRGEDTLILTEPALMHFGQGSAGTERIHLVGTAGEFDMSGNFTGDEGRATLRILETQPSILLEALTGYRTAGMDAAVEVDWSPGDLDLATRGNLAGFTWPDAPRDYDLSWAVEFDDGILSIEELLASTGGARVLDLAGTAALDPTRPGWFGEGPLELALSVQDELLDHLNIPGLELDGPVALELELDGSWSAIQGSARVSAERLEITSPGGTPHQVAAACTIAIGEELLVEELDLRIDSVGHVRASGRVGAPLDLAAIAAGELPLDAPIELSGELEGADLAWLAREIEGLRRLNGQLSGNLRVGGTLGEPEPQGSLHLTEGDLRLTQDLPPIRQLDAQIAVDLFEIRIERLVGEMGGAPISIEGRVDLTGEVPVTDLRITGESVLLQRTGGLLIRADADLVLSGPVTGCALAGGLTLRESRLFQDVDFLGNLRKRESRPQPEGLQLFSIRDAPLSDMRFDVHVTTAEPLRVISNVASGSLRLDLQLRGSGEVPMLGGRIFVDGLRLMLPAGRISFPTGLVLFDDPFHPSLELQGEARLAGYDVTMHVTGPYDSPEVALSSVPALSNDALLLLVVTGQVPATADSGARSAGRSISVYLARDFLQRSSGAGIDDEESVMDRLDIITGREISKSGVETVEVSYRIAEPWFDAGDEQFFVAERDVYEHVNAGLRIVFNFR